MRVHFSDFDFAKMNLRFFRAIAVSAFAVLLFIGFSGCADTQQNGAENSSSSAQVSTIPWNRPEKWEGGGQIGSMMDAVR